MGGIPEYFLSEDVAGESGRLEKSVNECLAFLPDGIMSRVLAGSLQALLDAWIIDQSIRTGEISDKVLTIVDRYGLHDTSYSLYLLRSQVIDIAAAAVEIAIRMLRMVPTTG